MADTELQKLRREFATQPSLEIARKIFRLENQREMPLVNFKSHSNQWKTLQKCSFIGGYREIYGIQLYHGALLIYDGDKNGGMCFVPGIRI